MGAVQASLDDPKQTIGRDMMSVGVGDSSVLNDQATLMICALTTCLLHSIYSGRTETAI